MIDASISTGFMSTRNCGVRVPPRKNTSRITAAFSNADSDADDARRRAVDAAAERPRLGRRVDELREVLLEEVVHEPAGREHAREVVGRHVARRAAHERIAAGDRLAAEVADVGVEQRADAAARDPRGLARAVAARPSNMPRSGAGSRAASARILVAESAGGGGMPLRSADSVASSVE